VHKTCLLGILLLSGCPQRSMDPVGERVSNEPAWTVPPHTCALGVPSTEVDEQGGISQFCHDGKKLHGEILRWHPNGQKATHGTYDRGKKTGTWIWWHDNGQIATRGDYTTDKEDGGWTWWHRNGEIEMRGDHLNGQRMGEWKTWFPTGQLRRAGHYRNGRRDGEWKTYTSQGELARRETWDLGRLVREKVLIEETDEDEGPPPRRP